MWNDFHENSIKSHRVHGEVATKWRLFCGLDGAVLAFVFAQSALAAKSTKKKMTRAQLICETYNTKTGKRWWGRENGKCGFPLVIKKAIGF
jgi:hypothetical protein